MHTCKTDLNKGQFAVEVDFFNQETGVYVLTKIVAGLHRVYIRRLLLDQCDRMLCMVICHTYGLDGSLLL